MESFENERRIQQGEDWNLDILLSQSATNEYIPFIIGQREHPYFVMTVASTKYEKNNRYVESWWEEINTDTTIDIEENGITPLFEQTVPEYIGELASTPNDKNSLFIAIAAARGIQTSEVTDTAFQVLYQYKITNESSTAGVQGTPYHYIYFDNNNIIHNDTYECRVRFNILSTSLSPLSNRDNGTSNWGSQNYMYQLTLVSGQEMVDTIIQAKNMYPDLDWRADWPVQGTQTDSEYRNTMSIWLQTTQENVFEFIKKRIPNYFQPDIDYDSPLGQIWTPQVILQPTKLQVDNNLRIII